MLNDALNMCVVLYEEDKIHWVFSSSGK